MPTCKKCGKHGLFLGLDINGLCSDCWPKQPSKIIVTTGSKTAGNGRSSALSQMKKDNALADRQIAKLNKARETYEDSKNYEKLISVYEEVFSQRTPWDASTHKLRLSDYYLKVGRNDDSWKLLNSMILEYPEDLSRIRRAQFKQLKSEKKYKGALQMLFLYRFDDYKDYPRWQESDINTFIKDAYVLGKKVSIEQTDIDNLASILVTCVKDKRCDESKATDKYKKWFVNLNK